MGRKANQKKKVEPSEPTKKKRPKVRKYPSGRETTRGKPSLREPSPQEKPILRNRGWGKGFVLNEFPGENWLKEKMARKWDVIHTGEGKTIFVREIKVKNGNCSKNSPVETRRTPGHLNEQDEKKQTSNAA